MAGGAGAMAIQGSIPWPSIRRNMKYSVTVRSVEAIYELSTDSKDLIERFVKNDSISSLTIQIGEDSQITFFKRNIVSIEVRSNDAN